MANGASQLTGLDFACVDISPSTFWLGCCHLVAVVPSGKIDRNDLVGPETGWNFQENGSNLKSPSYFISKKTEQKNPEEVGSPPSDILISEKKFPS